MAEIHAQGIIHFDLKPENLLLVGGNIKIIDFGSSLVLPAGRDSVEVASVRGTETFLAPECYDSELVGGSSQGEERRFVTRLRSAEWQYRDTSYRHTPAPLQPEGGHLVARRAAHEAAAPGTRGQLTQVSLLDRGANEISRDFTIFRESTY